MVWFGASLAIPKLFYNKCKTIHHYQSGVWVREAISIFISGSDLIKAKIVGRSLNNRTPSGRLIPETAKQSLVLFFSSFQRVLGVENDNGLPVATTCYKLHFLCSITKRWPYILLSWMGYYIWVMMKKVVVMVILWPFLTTSANRSGIIFIFLFFVEKSLISN